MKGIIFRTFQSYVTDRWSEDIVDDMLSLPNLSTDGAYTNVGLYPHDEFVSQVSYVAQKVDIPVADLITQFGEDLFGKLAQLHPDLISSFDHCADLLDNIEAVIHRDVRKIYHNAELPTFRTLEKQGEQSITIEYQSARPFADLAHGLILGAVSYYGLNESSTILRDDIGTDKMNARFRVVFDGKDVPNGKSISP